MEFYTETLGFEKRSDIPLGDVRWMTVAPPGEPEGVELLLERDSNPIARAYQTALFEAGIPTHATLAASDIDEEYERMSKLGVVLTTAPTRADAVTEAV